VVSEFQDIYYFHCRKVMKSGVQETCELKLLRTNNASFFAQIESRPVRDANHAIHSIRMTVSDIHEKKLLSMKYRERAEKSELLLNLLPHPAILINSERQILAANLLARKNGAEVGGLSASGDFVTTSQPHKPVQVSGLKECQGIFCLPDDDSNQQWLISVIENSNDAICVFDMLGNISAWNKMAENIYGYTASEALELTIHDLVPSNLKKETRTLFRDVGSGILVQPFETKRVAKDGRLIDVWLTITRLIQNNDIVGIATTERDISEHNRRLTAIRKLPQRIILAQEKERNRVSQEIHSDLGQSLLALKMFVVTSASGLAAETPQVTRLLGEVKNRLTSTIKKARDLSHKLAPTCIKYLGLILALQKMIDSLGFSKGVKFEFVHTNVDQVTFRSKDIIIYRVVQETLNNILKHAQATSAKIEAFMEHSMFTLVICDNGMGFDPSIMPHSRGLGLALMKEQAALIHGTLGIESQPGKGTTIRLDVPVKEKNRQERP